MVDTVRSDDVSRRTTGQMSPRTDATRCQSTAMKYIVYLLSAGGRGSL